MARHSRVLSLVLLLALTACTTLPSHAPRVAKAPSMHLPTPLDSRHVEASLDAELSAQADARAADVWLQLRSSFVMADCDGGPSVLHWAKRYTRNSQRFASRLHKVLPQLAYIQQIAAQYDIPGEFALLPWVESHYRALPGKRDGAAGMWQIMPRTATAIGLRIDHHYDGRLDLQASTNAVMQLLSTYHERFQDWRLADYAYNAGEFATARFIRKHGTPAQRPTIPAWPARNVTRQHLTRLLAMACVISDPQRFGVTLPTLSPVRRLVQVPVLRQMPIALAADRADMSVEALKYLNAGYRSDVIHAGSDTYLLLPVDHARQFRAGSPQQTDATETTAGYYPLEHPSRTIN